VAVALVTFAVGRAGRHRRDGTLPNGH
jgi:hypothetical protein